MKSIIVGANNLVDSVEQIAAFYPSLVNRAEQWFELSGVSGNVRSPYQVSLNHIDAAIGRLKRLRKEMQDLSVHRHEWSEDDYCIYCGADGRA